MSKPQVKVPDWQKNIFQDGSSSMLFKLLILTDLIFIFIHFLLKTTSLFENQLYLITEDLSYAEIFQFIKFVWIIALLVAIAQKTKMPGYLSWAFLFIYVLLDDSLQIHETYGFYLASEYSFPAIFGLRPVDLGELAILSCAGLILLPWPIWFYWRGLNRYKTISTNFFILFLIFGFFGVFLDMIHEILHVKYIYGLLSITEDGGEMIAISFFTTYLFIVFLNPDQEISFLSILKNRFYFSEPSSTGPTKNQPE